MVFVDPDFLRNSCDMPLESFYLHQLARTELLNNISRLPLCDRVVARAATSDYSLDPIGEDFIRVGDSCICLNPLSSTGVERALQSGCTAATAVHTMISRPDRTELCLKFYRDRQDAAVSSHTVWSATHFNSVTRFREFGFWQARSRLQERDADESAPTLPSTGSPVKTKAVSIDTRVRISDRLRFVESPCIVGDEIRAHPTLLHPHLDRPVAFIDGIDLNQLLNWPCPSSETPRFEKLSELITQWSQHVPLERAMRIVAWLLEKEILEPIL